MRKIIYSILIASILVVGGTVLLDNNMCPDWVYWQIWGWQVEHSAVDKGWADRPVEPSRYTAEEMAEVAARGEAILNGDKTLQ